MDGQQALEREFSNVDSVLLSSYGSKGWGFESLRARHSLRGQGYLLGRERWPSCLSEAMLWSSAARSPGGQLATNSELTTEAYAVRFLDALRKDTTSVIRQHDVTALIG